MFEKLLNVLMRGICGAIIIFFVNMILERKGISLGVEKLSTAIKRLQRGDLAETLLSDGIDEATVKQAAEIVLSFHTV